MKQGNEGHILLTTMDGFWKERLMVIPDRETYQLGLHVATQYFPSQKVTSR